MVTFRIFGDRDRGRVLEAFFRILGDFSGGTKNRVGRGILGSSVHTVPGLALETHCL